MENLAKTHNSVSTAIIWPEGEFALQIEREIQSHTSCAKTWAMLALRIRTLRLSLLFFFHFL